MGDKAGARRLMAAAGVPMVPGSPGPVADVAAAEAAAAGIGFPVILKAAGGGGGIGMARVGSGRPTWRRRSRAARGGPRRRSATRRSTWSATSSGLATSRCRSSATPHGAAVHLHERECSIQRRHQKLIEESPAPGLRAGDQGAAHRGRPWRARGPSATSTRGPCEFLVDAAGEFYFLEMNTRLQVEHPVTEEVTGLDLVVEQLRVAAGRAAAVAPGRRSSQRGAAIECRIYAEDPDKNFLPSPGTITRLVLPAGPGLRRRVRGGDGQRGLRALRSAAAQAGRAGR